MATLTAMSPRISFSHDIDLSLPSAASPRLDASLAIDDFDFSVSLDAISIHDPAPADRLFSHGMLLPQPLSSLNPTPPQPPVKLSLSAARSSSSSSSPKPSFWNTIGRSSSVGSAGSTKSRLTSACPFPRSKSAGSACPSTKNHQKQVINNRNCSSYSTAVGGYYYSYSGSGKSAAGVVRISPVINVPAHFIPRGGSSGGTSTSSARGGGGGGGRSVNSIFAYLLCNCRDKNGKELVCGGEI